jgi:RNA polymerase sigma-70 factor (ECF subfamily)
VIALAPPPLNEPAAPDEGPIGAAPPSTDSIDLRYPQPTNAADLTQQLQVFIEADYTSVVAAVGLITRDRSGAEDAVQEAMVKLLAHPPAEPLQSLAAWITVVASNDARTKQRRRGAEERALRRLGGRRSTPTNNIPDTLLDADRVLAAVDQLPLRQRQITIMHYYLDNSVLDIADGLGISEGTVKTQLHRARQALSALLGTDDEPDEPTGASGSTGGAS